MRSGWQWGPVINDVTGLSHAWRQRLSQYEHIYIGYSGGLDSTVLLTMVAACPELLQRITAIHVHHGLSSYADQWFDHCQQYCQRLGVTYKGIRVGVVPGANLEERARVARYQVFDDFVTTQDALLLAHHQNDQAETVLLNLLRGTGLDGLCAMPEQRVCGKGVLLRPLLQSPRQDVYEYAQRHGLQWIEDEMNAASEWSRGYLRQQIIPLLQVKWPNLVATVATSAQHCQQAKKALDAWIELDCPDLSQLKLEMTAELLADTVRCTQVLRAWLKYHGHRSPTHACIQQILQTVVHAGQDAMPNVQWEDWQVRRYRQTLYLVAANASMPQNLVWDNFPEPIAWTDNWFVVATPDPVHGTPISHASRIEVKVRTGGESLHWHGQTQCLKKLFQSWLIPPWDRTQWPLVYVNDQLRVVPDYAQSDLLLSDDPSERYTISTYKN